MIIQAYLIFCHLADERMDMPIAEFISNNNTSTATENTDLYTQNLGMQNLNFLGIF